MKIFTPKVIENCPYTAIITYPPIEPHRNTFFKIMYVESGSAILTLFSKKGKRTQIHVNVDRGVLFPLGQRQIPQSG